MIFAVAGTQLPFPRLFETLERIARRQGIEVIAQTGEAGRQSDAMQCESRIEPARFEKLISTCSVVVGHAGIGVIIAAATHGKPLIVMPRRAALGEHRNDHQLATVDHFKNRPGFVIVNDEAELEAALMRTDPEPMSFQGSKPRLALIEAIGAAIAS